MISLIFIFLQTNDRYYLCYALIDKSCLCCAPKCWVSFSMDLI